MKNQPNFSHPAMAADPIVRDYLKAHDAQFRIEGTNTRIRVAGVDIVIRNTTHFCTSELINRAACIMINRFQKNISGTRLKFDRYSIEKIALRIALHNLYLLSSWSRYIPKYLAGNRPVTPGELLRSNTTEIVLEHCESQYPDTADFRAACLLAISMEELQRWKKARLPQKMCTNNSLYRKIGACENSPREPLRQNTKN